MNAYLGKGVVFEGRFEFSGMAQVSGVIKGDIVSDGELLVGVEGEITGELNVGALRTSGKFHGNVNAKRKVTLNKNSYTEGEIKTPSLEIEEGAAFEGMVMMGKKGDK